MSCIHRCIPHRVDLGDCRTRWNCFRWTWQAPPTGMPSCNCSPRHRRPSRRRDGNRAITDRSDSSRGSQRCRNLADVEILHAPRRTAGAHRPRILTGRVRRRSLANGCGKGLCSRTSTSGRSAGFPVGPGDTAGEPVSPLANRVDVTPARPTSIYGATKLTQELMCSAWTAATGTSLSVLRLPERLRTRPVSDECVHRHRDPLRQAGPNRGPSSTSMRTAGSFVILSTSTT